MNGDAEADGRILCVPAKAISQGVPPHSTPSLITSDKLPVQWSEYYRSSCSARRCANNDATFYCLSDRLPQSGDSRDRVDKAQDFVMDPQNFILFYFYICMIDKKYNEYCAPHQTSDQWALRSLQPS